MQMGNIHPDAQLHPTVTVDPTAIIFNNVTIDENTFIGPYCVIGAPAEHKAFWGKEGKGVIIGANCVLTGFNTIDAGTEKPTILMREVWCLKRAHVGHDAYIGEGTVLSVNSIIGGHCLIECDCNIGIGAAIHQRVRIDRGCMIGGNAFVSKTLVTEPYRKYAGVPAKDIGPNSKP